LQQLRQVRRDGNRRAAQPRIENPQTRTGGQAMNAKTDRWESYTDRTGKRHWRWPATAAAPERDGRDVEEDSRPRAALPSLRQASLAPLPLRGK
jgi:hypothetical protein